MTYKRPALDGEKRLERARARRIEMAKAIHDPIKHPPLTVLANTDNDLTQRPMSFSKGLEHGPNGETNPADVDALRKALAGRVTAPEADAAFALPPNAYQAQFEPKTRAPDFRKFESPLTGLYYENQGLDPASVAMAAAPSLGTSELVFEMAEVYAMAVVRDMSFEELDTPTQHLYRIDPVTGKRVYYKTTDGGSTRKATVQDLIDALQSLSWFENRTAPANPTPPVDAAHARKRWADKPTLTALFRGSTPGAKDGGYISQFMLLGTPSRQNPDATHALQGEILFGTNRVQQTVDTHRTGLDYMTSFAEWLDVQNGVALNGLDVWEAERRFIKTPRDLAAYVHFDQLYQAYFNACLLLLDATGKQKVSFDPGFPETTADRRSGFASFGGPHVLSLMTEVATRGLRAVRRQKFQIHLRGRPERLAALIALHANDKTEAIGADAEGYIAAMANELGVGETANSFTKVMEWINALNKAQNAPEVAALRAYQPVTGSAPTHHVDQNDKNFLLPMAFPEGSPMHAAYGAGHATVAGACTTILKAFFDLGTRTVGDAFGIGAKVNSDGKLERHIPAEALTLNGELDKLAANISVGRNMAGVHYYSDYFDSLRMGERVAAGVLLDQLRAYTEKVELSFTSFDGELIKMSTAGTGTATISVDGAAADAWWQAHFTNQPSAQGAAADHELFASNWHAKGNAFT